MSKSLKWYSTHETFTLNSPIIMPTPSSITHAWSGGSCLGVVLGIQIATGVSLGMCFSVGFESGIYLGEEIQFGWLLRSSHANGASLFFILLYLHLARGLYYGSYRKSGVWVSGVGILILVMATAFLGYVLPWGQMSYWGATVITNLISVIPYLGESIVNWVWGGSGVSAMTASRFGMIHYFLPGVITIMVGGHLLLLHEVGSSDSVGSESSYDKVPLWPYFLLKDVVAWVGILILVGCLVLAWPWGLGDPENFVEADAMMTPEHIKPEWYFLFAYAILRAVPNKLGGVIGLVSALGVLMSWSGSEVRWSSVWVWVWLSNVLVLSWLGGGPVEEPYVVASQVSSVVYFGWFL